MSNEGSVFWIKDPRVLYQNSGYLEFIPTPEMDRVSQLNALTRLSIYVAILAFVLGLSSSWIQIAFLFILFLIFLYLVFDSDPNQGVKDALRTRYMSEADIINNENPINLEEQDDPFIIETGYYDSDGRLTIDRYLGSKTSARRRAKISLEDYLAYRDSIERHPTINNPLMNPLLEDISLGGDEGPLPANANDAQIKDEITRTYNDKMYRDIDDLFERENSQRQFYTIPQSYPNDQTSFANWLYKKEDICKVNQNYCLRNDDYRYRRINPI